MQASRSVVQYVHFSGERVQICALKSRSALMSAAGRNIFGRAARKRVTIRSTSSTALVARQQFGRRQIRRAHRARRAMIRNADRRDVAGSRGRAHLPAASDKDEHIGPRAQLAANILDLRVEDCTLPDEGSSARRESRYQPGDRLSPGEGSPASLPEEGAARPPSARSAGERLGQRGRPDAESGARLAPDRRARGAAPPASGARRRRAPYAGAAHSELTRPPWFGAGSDFPPGASAGAHGALGLLRHARSRGLRRRRSARASTLSLLACRS